MNIRNVSSETVALKRGRRNRGRGDDDHGDDDDHDDGDRHRQAEIPVSAACQRDPRARPELVPKAFQAARDRFASCDSNIMRGLVCHFCCQQAIEITGATKH